MPRFYGPDGLGRKGKGENPMKLRTLRALTLAPMAAALALSGPALADQLKMKNGDVITGEVKKLEDGKVFIEPAYGSEFSVDLAEVVSIEADQVFEVELENGEKVEATFTGGEAGTQTVVVDGAPLEVAITDLAAATEPEAWYDRVSHVDVNITENSGNTDSRNWLLFADTAVKLGDHRHLGELTVTREKIDGETTKKQDLFNYNYNWLFSGPWYLGGMFTYERDPIKDLDHRYTTGVLLGRDIFDESDRFLTMSVGAGWSEEEFFGQPKDSGATALWNLRYRQDFVDGKFAFFHNHNINYQLYGDENMIFKSNTGLQFDLIKDIYAKISFRYDYETEPAAGAENEDTTLAIGVGAQF
jgi:putative salt-induced outer membrane protein YdiY